LLPKKIATSERTRLARQQLVKNNKRKSVGTCSFYCYLDRSRIAGVFRDQTSVDRMEDSLNERRENTNRGGSSSLHLRIHACRCVGNAMQTR
jgi:hypothetical protein